jgi:hypothetical protein
MECSSLSLGKRLVGQGARPGASPACSQMNGLRKKELQESLLAGMASVRHITYSLIVDSRGGAFAGLKDVSQAIILLLGRCYLVEICSLRSRG